MEFKIFLFFEQVQVQNLQKQTGQVKRAQRVLVRVLIQVAWVVGFLVEILNFKKTTEQVHTHTRFRWFPTI